MNNCFGKDFNRLNEDCRKCKVFFSCKKKYYAESTRKKDEDEKNKNFSEFKLLFENLEEEMQKKIPSLEKTTLLLEKMLFIIKNIKSIKS